MRLFADACEVVHDFLFIVLMGMFIYVVILAPVPG